MKALLVLYLLAFASCIFYGAVKSWAIAFFGMVLATLIVTLCRELISNHLKNRGLK